VKRSLAQLANSHAGLMYRIAYSLLRNTHDAEDAVQDCLLKLHRLGGWEEALDERAFLAKVVWRCAMGRLPRGQTRTLEPEDEEWLAATDRTPEASAIADSNEERLHKLVDGLPLDLREPLLLSGFDELTSAKIGEILGIPEGTVRTRIKRAREELRRRW
jgi:RNA polymerase sigma-70 factor (ECF subfamily)